MLIYGFYPGLQKYGFHERLLSSCLMHTDFLNFVKTPVYLWILSYFAIFISVLRLPAHIMLSILFFQDFAKAQNDSAKNITCDTSVFKIRVKYFIAVVLFLPSFALAQLVHNMIRKSQTKHELTLSSRKIEKDTILYKSVNGNDSVRQILYHGKKSKTKTYKTITYFEDGKIARIFNFKSAPGRKTYIGSYYYPDGNIEKYSRGGIKKGRHGYRSMRRVHYSYYPKGKIESLTKKGLFRSLTYKEWDKNGRIMKDTSTQD